MDLKRGIDAILILFRDPRQILNMHTIVIDRRNTNAEIYHKANAAVASRYNYSSKLVWYIEIYLHYKNNIN